MIKLLLAISLAAITALSLLATRVSKVEINQNSCITVDQVNLKGKIIFTLRQDALKKDLKEKFPCLADLKLTKNYPSKIILEAKTQNPAAKIANTQLLITAEGLVVSGKSDSLPQLFLPSGVQAVPNEKITNEISLYAANLASLLTKSDFHATNIRILSSSDIAVYDSKETVAIFSAKESVNLQVDSLQQVLAKAKIGGASLREGDDKIAKIDLRFEKPVITFK